VKDPKKFQSVEKQLDREFALFSRAVTMHTGQSVDNLVHMVQRIADTLGSVAQDVQTVALDVQTVALDVQTVAQDVKTVALDVQMGMHISTSTKLPYAQGATWSPKLMCQPGTRESILDEIMTWIEGNTPERIFCLTGAPGAGKTAIAHSVAKLCHDKGWLVTAFFFNKEDTVKAPMLFSTITCDLASRFPSFRASVSQTIQKDPSLAAADMTRLFQELIVPFSEDIPQNQPVLIVLDGLDEGLSKELLKILKDGISLLPGAFQFFVTTRNILEVKQLLRAPHVHHRRFNHSGGSWVGDVEKVTRTHLEGIAEEKDLEGWPTVEVEEEIVKRSEGLMIWVVAFCQFLESCFDPEKDLVELLNQSLPSGRGAQKQMDELYAAILLKWDWKDTNFVEAYDHVMGTILASKVPLTVHALHSLHAGRVPVQRLLQNLRPLLLLSDGGKPVQILHQSLHDLLVWRAKDVENWKLFAIDEKLQHKKLATLCIQVINAEVSEDSPGTGYIDAEERIPKIPDDAIPEHVMYACRFWIEHLLAIEEPEPELIDGIQLFLNEKLLLWLEVIICKGQLRQLNFSSFVDWIHVSSYFKSHFLLS